MGKYTTDPLQTGREIEKADGLGTLGGEFGLCWNDAVPLTTGAHNAFLSAFFAAGGVFDHLVDTCPLKLTSNNAPTNRETLGTAVVGMTNGSYRYRHFDNLSGDAVTVSFVPVAPEIAVKTPFTSSCHWNVSPSPVAFTSNVASSPSSVNTSPDAHVTTGSAATVSVTGSLVFVVLRLLVTTQ